MKLASIQSESTIINTADDKTHGFKRVDDSPPIF